MIESGVFKQRSSFTSNECRVFLKEIREEIVKIGKRVLYLGLIRNFTFAIHLK